MQQGWARPHFYTEWGVASLKALSSQFSPYEVSGDLIVESGNTWTIESGTELEEVVLTALGLEKKKEKASNDQ